MSTQSDLLWDTRLLSLRLRNGEITQEQLSTRLHHLPDVSEKAAVFEVNEIQPTDATQATMTLEKETMVEEEAETYDAPEYP